MVAIFIDFKSAYNTIMRKKLYEIFEGKLILEREEVKFIEILHYKLHFKVQKEKYYYDSGIHQGSTLSPALFNVYAEEFIF